MHLAIYAARDDVRGIVHTHSPRAVRWSDLGEPLPFEGGAVPTAAYWCEKYNRVIVYAAQHGLPGARYLPAVPVERIAKVFGEGSPEAKPVEEVNENVGEGSPEAKPVEVTETAE
jgi:hypothetical protein